MYTALRATSQTLVGHLRQQFEADSLLRPFFGAGSGGTMRVTLNSPQEMAENQIEGLSVWLYRVVRDEERLNAFPERISLDLLRRPPLPVRLHYLMTPITAVNSQTGPETEQVILGKVLQVFHDHPTMCGTDLRDDLSGTEAELSIRLEAQSMEEITRVWQALEGSYELSLSYEVSAVDIAPAMQPERIRPVVVAMPEYGLIVPE